MFYVYAHIRLDTNQPFYIGKGKDKRAFIHASRSNYWKSIVKKHGYRVEFIETNLTEQDAMAGEVYWITYYGRKDLGSGILINFTSGGDGTSGRVVEQHVRDAVANANRKRISSTEHKQAVGAIFKGKCGSLHNRSMRVRCTETGKVFGSQCEAERYYNLGGGCVRWSIKNKRPIFGMHFEIAS